MKATRRREAYRERMDLLRKLAAAKLPGYTRGELFTDREVVVGGKSTLVTAPSSRYRHVPLDELRELVTRKLAGRTPAVRSNPFEPSAEAAAKATAAATPVDDTSRRLSELSSASAEQLAKTRAALLAQGAQS
jgi:hypothetical protein